MYSRLYIGMAVFFAMCFSAEAQGLFDFLDPCIAAKNDYWQARGNIMQTVERDIKSVNTEKPTQAFRDFWWDEKKKLLQKYFDDNLGDVVRASGGNEQKAFEIWLAIQIRKQGGMNAVEPTIEREFRNTKRLLFEKQKGQTEDKLEQTKKSLYDGCPEDVGNQVFRGAVNILVAPVNIVKGNFDAANRESGDLAKLLREITGVSARDIGERGVCGGDNSEMRKLFGSLC